MKKSILAQILNYCMGVATGSALLRYSEGKISAVHGGDSSEYAILEMSELFEAMADYLKAAYPGCQFAGASYDHSIATAVWEISQCNCAQDSLIETYKEALDYHGIPYDTLKPALRAHKLGRRHQRRKYLSDAAIRKGRKNHHPWQSPEAGT